MDGAPKMWTATITGKRNLTGNIWSIRFHCDDSSFMFLPGQYGTIIIDEKTRRQYSFASPPASLPEGEFVVDTSPMGKGSLFFLNAEVGGVFQMLAPLGKFQLNDTSAKKVLVATGTGIAPFRSMIQAELARSALRVTSSNVINPQPVTRNPQLHLYWGLRHEEDMYWQDELKAITGQLTGFQYFLCLSKPGENWMGAKGHVTEHVLANETDVVKTEFYLCGNKAMVEELSSALKNRGVAEENIKTDVFF
jgi:CDP-4-dehydro-6-deoxyglucose reductase, E3